MIICPSTSAFLHKTHAYILNAMDGGRGIHWGQFGAGKLWIGKGLITSFPLFYSFCVQNFCPKAIFFNLLAKMLSFAQGKY